MELKEFNSTIQVCPYCGKIDVYKNDGHYCNKRHQEHKEENNEYYD